METITRYRSHGFHSVPRGTGEHLSKCARFLAQALEISHISRGFFSSVYETTENKIRVAKFLFKNIIYSY